MEERIIDDEIGRKVRLKKTKDGYVDVTDELTENGELPEGEYEDGGEEIEFEYPVLDTDEDDEDLVGLSPEEAAALVKRKEEEAARRKADYEQACSQGERFLENGSFHAAEIEFEKALQLDDEARRASVGYWRAKTSDFAEPDVLIEEYAEAGIESLEYDLGIGATDDIKRTYSGVFKRRLAELEAEEKPLAETVEEKQSKRREVLSARLKKSTTGFIATMLPTAALLVLAIVIGLMNFTTRENTYVLPTILLVAGFVVAFIAFMVCTNKWLNDLRMRRVNERLSSTEEGARLQKIRDYKELYSCLLVAETDGEVAEESAEE